MLHVFSATRGNQKKGGWIHTQLPSEGNWQRILIAPFLYLSDVSQRQKTRETKHRFRGLTVPEIIPRLYKSSTAAPMLCLSVGHLQRLKDSQGGPLIEGKHWFPGPTANSPIRWDVAAILELLRKRGQLRRQADQALMEGGVSVSNLREVGYRKPQAAGRQA